MVRSLLSTLAVRVNIPASFLALSPNSLLAAATARRQHGDESVFVSAELARHFIRGGKGGFGTLLKNQSKRSGAKTTLDFGACRDLNGRRLRHVNDEIKLRPKNILLLSLMEIARSEVQAQQARPRRTKTSNHKQNQKGVRHKERHNLSSCEAVPPSSSSCCSDASTEVAVSGKVIQNPRQAVHPHAMDVIADDEDDAASSSSSDSDFDDDDDRVLTGIGAMTSSCGTYAVADREGLLVLPHKPVDHQEPHPPYCRSFVVHDAPPPPPPPSSPRTPHAHESDSSGSKLPYKLEHGTKVQIVHIEDGWAMLARNEGFLFVDHAQLVKVGGPLDKACEIEGLLVSLHKAKINLEEQRTNLDNIESGMIQKLAKVLRRPSDHFIPLRRSQRDDVLEEEEEEDNKMSCRVTPPLLGEVPEHSPLQPMMESCRVTPPLLGEVPEHSPPQQPREEVLGPTTRTPSPDTLRLESSFCGSQCASHLGLPRLSPAQHRKIGASFSFPASPRTPPQMTSDRGTSVNAATCHVPRASRRSPVSTTTTTTHHHPHRRHTTIDFRTGMSGHCALLSSKKHTHHHPSARPRGSVRTMGEHRGLGGSK